MTDKNLPNFLMVGTAKAGTSSIAKYLDTHPQVFIPEIKEPRYFLHDVFGEVSTADPLYDYLIESSVLNWDDYLDLYQNVDSGVTKFGDASVQYLYHYDTVIPQIKEKLGDIPIIIVLRDPTERAFSNYKYQFRKQFLSFEDALEKEEERKNNHYNSFWFYKSMGMYSNQVIAYKKAFSNVHVCLYDDLIKDPKEFMVKIYDFLNVDSSFTNDVEKRYNETIIPRNKILLYINHLKSKNNITLKFLPLSFRNFVKNILFTKNTEKINPKTSESLKSFFRDDIECLEKTINRDLSKWYTK